MPVPDIQKVLDKLERGESVEVLPTLTYLNELLPSGLATCILLARAYEADKRWRAALSAWQDAHFLMPNSPVIQKGIQRCARALSEVSETATQPQIEEAKTEAKVKVTGVVPPEELEQSDLTLDLSSASDRPKPSTPRFTVAGDENKAIPIGHRDKAKAKDLEQYNDLDRLINALNSARIVPDPDMDAYPSPDLENDVEDIVSETLARIYAAQQQYGEAARVYELLAQQHPRRAQEFKEKAEWMRKHVRNE